MVRLHYSGWVAATSPASGSHGTPLPHPTFAPPLTRAAARDRTPASCSTREACFSLRHDRIIPGTQAHHRVISVISRMPAALHLPPSHLPSRACRAGRRGIVWTAFLRSNRRGEREATARHGRRPGADHVGGMRGGTGGGEKTAIRRCIRTGSRLHARAGAAARSGRRAGPCLCSCSRWRRNDDGARVRVAGRGERRPARRCNIGLRARTHVRAGTHVRVRIHRHLARGPRGRFQPSSLLPATAVLDPG